MLPVVWFDFIRDISLIRFAKKKPATVLVAGFTIRSLKPVVTTLGRQFIASTSEYDAAPPHGLCQGACWKV